MINNEKDKLTQDKIQLILSELLKGEDNKQCVDCNGKRPQWASWSLGIFLCIRCAGIHRNLGVHISRVKSVNLDSWTYQQVAMMKEIGNSRGRAIYEANLEDNFSRPQTDATMEQFIRAKYEHKRYMAKEWIPPVLSPDIIADVCRQEDSKVVKKRTVTPGAGVSVCKTEAKPQRGRPETTNHKPVSNGNKVDLLGLDNVNTDDSFGDFIFASPSNTAAVKTLTKDSVTVSSAFNDLIGLDLNSNDVIGGNSSVNVVASSGASVVPTINGQMDKNSILALYNSNGNGTSTGASSLWPGMGPGQYQRPDPSSSSSQQSPLFNGGHQWTASSMQSPHIPFSDHTAVHSHQQHQTQLAGLHGAAKPMIHSTVIGPVAPSSSILW